MSERIVSFILDSRIANTQGVATLIYGGRARGRARAYSRIQRLPRLLEAVIGALFERVFQKT